MPLRVLRLPRLRPPCAWGCVSAAPVAPREALSPMVPGRAKLVWTVLPRSGCQAGVQTDRARSSGERGSLGGGRGRVLPCCRLLPFAGARPPGLSHSNGPGVPVRGRARCVPARLSGARLRRGSWGGGVRAATCSLPGRYPRAGVEGWGWSVGIPTRGCRLETSYW